MPQVAESVGECTHGRSVATASDTPAAHRWRPERRPRRGRWALAVAGLVGVLLLGACSTTGQPQQPGFTELRAFAAGESVTQTFVPRVDGVDRFGMLVATYEEANPRAVLRLHVEGAGQTRTAVARGREGEIPDADWLTFTFAPIPDAADEDFAATVTFDGQDRVAYYVNPHDPYPDGALDGGDADLAFRVGHGDRVGGALAVLGRTAREFATRLAADPWFAAVWLALLAGAVVGLAPIRRRR